MPAIGHALAIAAGSCAILSGSPRQKWPTVFEFFANIFDLFEHEPDSLPEDLIHAAIERAVDGTDPRLRIDAGYAKQLRKPIIHAVEHVIGLVESLPAPAEITPGNLSGQSDVAAIFYSEQRLRNLLQRDQAMKEFRENQVSLLHPCHTLLLVRALEKHGFGTATINGESRTEVAQTTIDFEDHHFIDPETDAETNLNLAKRRAFDVLLHCALEKITEDKEDRDHLVQRRALLQAKLEICKRHGGIASPQTASEQVEVQHQLETIEEQLEALGPDEDVLGHNLAIISEVLAEAEKHLWLEPAPMCLDRFYVLHPPGGEVPEIPFQRICDSTGAAILLRRLSLSPDLLS